MKTRRLLSIGVIVLVVFGSISARAQIFVYPFFFTGTGLPSPESSDVAGGTVTFQTGSPSKLVINLQNYQLSSPVTGFDAAFQFTPSSGLSMHILSFFHTQSGGLESIIPLNDGPEVLQSLQSGHATLAIDTANFPNGEIGGAIPVPEATNTMLLLALSSGIFWLVSKLQQNSRLPKILRPN